jgi:uncharacterized protein YecE (DUF72 family)
MFPLHAVQQRCASVAAGLSRHPLFTALGSLNRPYTLPVPLPPILLGTSSFSASGWEGSFYPNRLRSSDYLSYYADCFPTVEVDSTFYACPTPRTVSNWAARTPENFIFSVKVPQTITHDKVLLDCARELQEFLKTMDILGPKLGPTVFQFPAFDRWKFPTQKHFLDVLTPFLKNLPRDKKFAVEIRDRNWLDATLAEILRERSIALVLQDISNMPAPQDLLSGFNSADVAAKPKKFDPITAGWTYIRWLGDRKGIEKLTTSWGKPVVDRAQELTTWVDYCYEIRKRGVVIYGYANNHYAGHAPATIAQFISLWNAKGFPEIAKPKPSQQERTLFPL